MDMEKDGEREPGRGRERVGTRGKWRERETELGGRMKEDDGRERETLIERERQLPSRLNVWC